MLLLLLLPLLMRSGSLKLELLGCVRLLDLELLLQLLWLMGAAGQHQDLSDGLHGGAATFLNLLGQGLQTLDHVLRDGKFKQPSDCCFSVRSFHTADKGLQTSQVQKLGLIRHVVQKPGSTRGVDTRSHNLMLQKGSGDGDGGPNPQVQILSDALQ